MEDEYTVQSGQKLHLSEKMLKHLKATIGDKLKIEYKKDNKICLRKVE